VTDSKIFGSGTDFIWLLVMFLLGQPLQKSVSDQIRMKFGTSVPASQFASIDRVRFQFESHFQMAAMTSFHREKCCHLHEASAGHIFSDKHLGKFLTAKLVLKYVKDFHFEF